MHPLDWFIITLPLVLVGWICYRTQRYVHGVADFLAAGRVAGRYVVAVASAEAALGLITVVAGFEGAYKSGFAFSFWGQFATPVGLLLTLTGFVIYRYRETRALTLGQFLEIRYSRKVRMFAGWMQAVSGIVNYGLFPAVGARFLVYFLDLPQTIAFLGMRWPTFALVMAGFLLVAVLIATLGGQVTIMTADCVMGILSYPMYLAVVVSVFVGFSWWGEMAPALSDREPGMSMLNPFDISELRDFNLFFVLVGIFGAVYSRMAWSGLQGYNAAARNAHEQKMGGILGVWRGGFSALMVALLAIVAYTYFHHENHREAAAKTELSLTAKALEDTALEFAPAGFGDGSLTATQIEEWRLRVLEEDPARHQVFQTISNQMRVPMALRDILPVGVLGVFCAIMILLMISTDSSYMHSWGSIIVQDIVLPLRKRAFTPAQQLFWLRFVIVLVAVYAFLFSLLFGQVTYIAMFFALTGSIWLGGAGALIIGGLYWKRGTSAGAMTALIVSLVCATLGFLGMNYWVGVIHPALQQIPGLLSAVTAVVEGISRPLEPFILWRVTPDKFFMNGVEVSFATSLAALGSYIAASLLTCRESFNLDRMLHRGAYRRADEGLSAPTVEEENRYAKKHIWKTLTGIDEQFSRGDRIISYSVLIYSLGWSFGSFVVILVWNLISPWPESYWVNWFFISTIVVGSLIGIVSTFWFAICGTLDLRAMFQSLRERHEDVRDDGRVIGHSNADDLPEPSDGRPRPE